MSPKRWNNASDRAPNHVMTLNLEHAISQLRSAAARHGDKVSIGRIDPVGEELGLRITFKPSLNDMRNLAIASGIGSGRTLRG